jgi:hypothetical protein
MPLFRKPTARGMCRCPDEGAGIWLLRGQMPAVGNCEGRLAGYWNQEDQDGS